MSSSSSHPIGEPRRRAKRYTPLKSEVVCVPRGFWTSVIRKKNVAVRIKDISLGGVHLIVNAHLEPGLKTDVVLIFPGFQEPVEAEADVRWCHRDTLSLEPRWHAGLVFKRLTAKQEANLREVDRIYIGV